MTKVRHVLGISGGKDSAALAIYMKQKYPTLEVEYYNSDTGCELEETEKLVDNLESFLGKYNPQIEMFARFKMKSSFHKTKRII